MTMRKACVAETGADINDVIASKGGNLADNPAFRCYIRCFFEHSGMMEEDGSIHFNKVMHLLTPSLAETAKYVMSECKTIRKYFENDIFLHLRIYIF